MGEIVRLQALQASGARNQKPDSPNPCICTSEVYVVFTSIEETLAAVRVGSQLARSLTASLTLVHFKVVPYAVPIDRPVSASPAETRAFMERVKSYGLDVRLRVFLCRSPRRAIPLAFRRRSLVVVGGRRLWWPARSARLRRALEAAGHFVVFVDEGRDAA